MLVLAEQHDKRDRLLQRLFEVGAGLDLDDLAAAHPHRLVVGETLLRRNDDPVDHAIGERQAQHLGGVVAGDAGGGAERHRGGAAAGDDARFGAGQLGDALARRGHQLVEVDELARRRVNRLAHLRQHQAAAMHRAHAAAIDERPDAKREIGVALHTASEKRAGYRVAAFYCHTRDGRCRVDPIRHERPYKIAGECNCEGIKPQASRSAGKRMPQQNYVDSLTIGRERQEAGLVIAIALGRLPVRLAGAKLRRPIPSSPASRIYINISAAWGGSAEPAGCPVAVRPAKLTVLLAQQGE